MKGLAGSYCILCLSLVVDVRGPRKEKCSGCGEGVQGEVAVAKPLAAWQVADRTGVRTDPNRGKDVEQQAPVVVGGRHLLNINEVRAGQICRSGKAGFVEGR